MQNPGYCSLSRRFPDLRKINDTPHEIIKQRPLQAIERRFLHTTSYTGEAVAVLSYVRPDLRATRRTGRARSRIACRTVGQRNGPTRELALREAIIVACGYARNNITEEIWAEIFGVHQTTVSRYISELTPLIDQATAEFRHTAEEAAEAIRDAIALVDGTLWPCWSWDGESKLWSGEKQDHGTRLPGCHQSPGSHNVRFRACYR